VALAATTAVLVQVLADPTAAALAAGAVVLVPAALTKAILS
jgi:hypothetical protein